MDVANKDLRDGSVVANIFSNFINGGHNQCGFVDVVTSDHRYLQQESFSVFMDCIRIWASAYENNQYDGRNEYACRLSKEIVDKVIGR